MDCVSVILLLRCCLVKSYFYTDNQIATFIWFRVFFLNRWDYESSKNISDIILKSSKDSKLSFQSLENGGG